MQDQQITGDVVMIRPVEFFANPETAISNSFQQKSASHADEKRAAQDEYDNAVKTLRDAGVRVHSFQATQNPAIPDAVFPNNWFSTHADGSVVLYPMLAANRRLERRPDILLALSKKLGFSITRTIDLAHYELQGKYLEGTGSLVLDRVNRIAYACHSPRTDPAVAQEFGHLLGYRVLTFGASDQTGVPIYHTNVLMSVGRKFAVVCADGIATEHREPVFNSLSETGHRAIRITQDQMTSFAGNILELRSDTTGSIVALSTNAYSALNSQQRGELELLGGPLVPIPIPTIEKLGGGSVRCMLAEVHLPTSDHSR